METLRGRSGKIVEILECTSVDNYCVQEPRFMKNSIWMICGKAAQYKLIWKGNDNSLRGIGIFLVKKLVDVTDLSRAGESLIFMTVLVQ